MAILPNLFFYFHILNFESYNRLTSCRLPTWRRLLWWNILCDRFSFSFYVGIIPSLFSSFIISHHMRHWNGPIETHDDETFKAGDWIYSPRPLIFNEVCIYRASCCSNCVVFWILLLVDFVVVIFRFLFWGCQFVFYDLISLWYLSSVFFNSYSINLIGRAEINPRMLRFVRVCVCVFSVELYFYLRPCSPHCQYVTNYIQYCQ